MTHYDDLYIKGGFKYTRYFGIKHLYLINKYYKVFNKDTRVMDAPCGDGFWSKLIEDIYGSTVTPVDISLVGSALASGIRHDLEIRNTEWEPHKFDLVFCRGISHLHHKDFNINGLHRVIDNFSNYAPKVLIIYSTNQSNKYIKKHYHHTRKSLDSIFNYVGTFRSRMIGGYYTALLDFSGVEGDLPR